MMPDVPDLTDWLRVYETTLSAATVAIPCLITASAICITSGGSPVMGSVTSRTRSPPEHRFRCRHVER